MPPLGGTPYVGGACRRETSIKAPSMSAINNILTRRSRTVFKRPGWKPAWAETSAPCPTRQPDRPKGEGTPNDSPAARKNTATVLKTLVLLTIQPLMVGVKHAMTVDKSTDYQYIYE